MSLKINVLIISMVVLTIFVKMVPAPKPSDNVRCDDALMAEMDLFEYPNKNVVTRESLEKIKNIYKTEILEYCKKNQIQTNNEEPNMSATLLYFKDAFNEFNRYKRVFSFGSYTFINFMILAKEKHDEGLKKIFDEFKNKQEINLRKEYQHLTFCSLPTEIEDAFFFEQLRFTYCLITAQKLALGDEKDDMEDLMIKTNTEIKTKNEIIEDCRIFNLFWNYYGFNLSVFYRYSILDKNFTFDIDNDEKTTISVNGVYTSMTTLEAFLHYFKESLDNYYNQIVCIKIDKLKEAQRTFYYKQMLRAMINIYHAYYEYNVFQNEKRELEFVELISTTRETLPRFVKLMIDVADAILQSNTNKKISNEEEQQLEFDNESDGIVIKDNYYSCLDLECAMPDKVNFKDILNYLIVKFKKDHKYTDDAVTAQG